MVSEILKYFWIDTNGYLLLTKVIECSADREGDTLPQQRGQAATITSHKNNGKASEIYPLINQLSVDKLFSIHSLLVQLNGENVCWSFGIIFYFIGTYFRGKQKHQLTMNVFRISFNAEGNILYFDL